MRRTSVLACLVFFCTAAAAWSVTLTDLGYTVLRQYSDSGVSYSDARDASGRTVTVGTTAALTQTQASQLQQFVTAFYSLTYVKVESLKVVFSSSNTQIVLVPASFVYSGVNIAQYTPSGMQFYMQDNLQYDFRLHVNTFFLRVSGVYTDEKTLAERLVQVIRNPTAYLKSQDPEYMLQRIDALEKELGDAVETNRRNESQLAALSSDYDALKQSFDDLKANHEKLASDTAAYEQSNDSRFSAFETTFNTLRYGLMVLHNRGLFGQIFLPDQKAVARIVELKQQTPDLSQADTMKQIESEGFKVSKNEVFLVFAVYFNEFK